jgi:polyphosphate kinase 2
MGSELKRDTLEDRVRRELADSIDEELELELGDDLLSRLPDQPDLTRHNEIDRKLYFTELLRLQRELIKLQAWVINHKLKVVVLFEGRDAAGKGGVIKRVTQRLNPRVCRTVALSAPSERERTQWYFQRYTAHLPAAGEIVLFDRSWYNRGGVERVMGFCSEAEVEEFFRSVPEFERMLVRSGILVVKYWFSITDEEQHLRFLMRIRDPLKQWKLSPHGPGITAALGGIHQGQGGDAGAHPYPGGPLVGDRGQQQAAGPAQLHPPSPAAGALPGGDTRRYRVAAARAQARLSAHAGRPRTLRPFSLLTDLN